MWQQAAPGPGEGEGFRPRGLSATIEVAISHKVEPWELTNEQGRSRSSRPFCADAEEDDGVVGAGAG